MNCPEHNRSWKGSASVLASMRHPPALDDSRAHPDVTACVLSLWHDWNVQHSDDELNGRHNHCRSARTVRTCTACSQGRQPPCPWLRCPVFVFCPGLAVNPSGRSLLVWLVPTIHQQEPPLPAMWHQRMPRSSLSCARMTVCGTGTSTSFSTTRGSWSTADHRVPSSWAILSTSITCSTPGTNVSAILRTSTICPTSGTGASSIGTGRRCR